MNRVHAIEFEDFYWFPQTLRNQMTDFYQSQMELFNLYQPAVELLAGVMDKTGLEQTIDLCSGGTGPNITLQQQIEDDYGLEAKATLTDKFPNLPAFKKAEVRSEGKLSYREDSIDACNVPKSLKGGQNAVLQFSSL